MTVLQEYTYVIAFIATLIGYGFGWIRGYDSGWNAYKELIEKLESLKNQYKNELL